MRRPWIVIAVIAVVLVVVRVCAWVLTPPPAPPPDDFGTVADFALTDQTGETTGRSDLLGKVWVAGFAFTRCTGPCPQVTATMAKLQAELKDEPDFRLVSFSVDPEHDTPEVLKAYSQVFAADPRRWFFLTGKKDDVYRLVQDSFHLGVLQNPGEKQPGQAVTHSTRLALVDRKGRVMGYFEGRQTDETGQPIDVLPQIKQAVKLLLREQP
jgi:cytochrome oxidase Cu insertion factor (SCO1/SenC/PrrC family)